MPDDMNEINSCIKENNAAADQTVSVNNKTSAGVPVVSESAEVVELDVVEEKSVETKQKAFKGTELIVDAAHKISSADKQPVDTDQSAVQSVEPKQSVLEVQASNVPESVQPVVSNPVEPSLLKEGKVQSEPRIGQKRSVRPCNSEKKVDEVVASSAGPFVEPPPSPIVSIPATQMILKILEKKLSMKTPGEFEYLVQWNDLSTTWELQETISCGDMLSNFEKTLAASHTARRSGSKSSVAPKLNIGSKRKREKSLNALTEIAKPTTKVKRRSTRTSAAKAKIFISEVTLENESGCASPRPIKRRKINDDEEEDEEEEEDKEEVIVGKSTSSRLARYLPKTYIAEAILDERMQGPVKQFLIKWKGYDDPAENTWEPAANFAKYYLLVEDFEQNRRREILKKFGPYSSASSLTTCSSSVNGKQETSWKKSVGTRKSMSSTPKKTTRLMPDRIKFTPPNALKKTADQNLEEEEDEEEDEEEELLEKEKVPAGPVLALPPPTQPIWRTSKTPTSNFLEVKGRNPLLFTSSLEFGMEKGLKLSCILKVTKGPMEVGPKALVRYAESLVQEWVPTSVIFKHYPQDLVHFYENKLKLFNSPARAKKPLQERKNMNNKLLEGKS